MSERSEHLIERAAAKLRATNAAPLADAPLNGEAPLDRASTGRMPLGRPPASDAPSMLSPAPAMLSPGPAGTPFQPITLPAQKMPAQEPQLAEPDRSATQALSFSDSVPETVPGPIPSPAAPFTRPVLAPVPPALTLPANTLAPASLSQTFAGPATSGQAAISPSRAGASLALQPPPIVQLDALERAGMVVARTTRTRISEEYRIAIGRILRILHETTNIQGARNVLMVTSARPGEGKSFTALNLAGSIAQNGTDAVLLVDVDPKVKPLSDMLGLGEAPGFLDLVSDPSLRPEDLLRVTAIPNLAVMPVGTRLGGAAQTIGGTASMRPIIPTITRLARRFPKHLIMLDAPPCLSTSDPHTLAPHVGQVVLVVEAERTQRSEVEAAVDLVRVCPSITLLLNKVRMTTSHTFGAYDYFGSYT